MPASAGAGKPRLWGAGNYGPNALFNDLGLGGFVRVLPAIGGLAVGALLLVMLSVRLHKSQTKREFCHAGLYFVSGRQGAGKTFLMVWAALVGVRRGLGVFANFWVCPRGSVCPSRKGEGEPCAFCLPKVRSWAEVLAIVGGSEWRPVLVLLDEAHLWWGSEEWDVGKELKGWVSQLRKRGLMVLCSSQDVTFISKRLRRLGFGVWEGKGAFRAHRYKLYGAQGFDPFSPKRPPSQGVFALRRSKRVMLCYNTREIVAGAELPRDQDFGAANRALGRGATPPPSEEPEREVTSARASGGGHFLTVGRR